ncbi:hypothetical protein BCR44DRAFT_42331, partial [Catenaria anguillulae PL171]
MLLTSVHIATSVAALLLASTPSTLAQSPSVPSSNTWGGCAICPAQPPVCEPGCPKCVVTLGSCSECATATCAPAGQADDGGLGPLGEDPINAKLPVNVNVGTEGGQALPGVVEASEKKSSAEGFKVTKVTAMGALVVAGALWPC